MIENYLFITPIAFTLTMSLLFLSLLDFLQNFTIKFMKSLQIIYQYLLRIKYPVSLPTDIGEALGIPIRNCWSFEEFFHQVISPSTKITNLKKYMLREEAEHLFLKAARKEKFCNNTLFSYYFNEGWLEFSLQFDNCSRLRRIYILHKQIEEPNGIELPLAND